MKKISMRCLPCIAISIGFLSSEGYALLFAGSDVTDRELTLAASHALEWDNFWHGNEANCRLSSDSGAVQAHAIVGAASASLAIPRLRCTITLELTSTGPQPVVVSPWRTSDGLQTVIRDEKQLQKVPDTTQVRQLRVPVGRVPGLFCLSCRDTDQAGQLVEAVRRYLKDFGTTGEPCAILDATIPAFCSKDPNVYILQRFAGSCGSSVAIFVRHGGEWIYALPGDNVVIKQIIRCKRMTVTP